MQVVIVRRTGRSSCEPPSAHGRRGGVPPTSSEVLTDRSSHARRLIAVSTKLRRSFAKMNFTSVIGRFGTNLRLAPWPAAFRSEPVPSVHLARHRFRLPDGH